MPTGRSPRGRLLLDRLCRGDGQQLVHQQSAGALFQLSPADRGQLCCVVDAASSKGAGSGLSACALGAELRARPATTPLLVCWRSGDQRRRICGCDEGAEQKTTELGSSRDSKRRALVGSVNTLHAPAPHDPFQAVDQVSITGNL